MPDLGPSRRAWGWFTAALCGAAGVVSLVQAAKMDYDFHHFYLDAAYVWEHGTLNPNLDAGDGLARRQLPFYLPAVPLLLAPLAAGGPLLAAGIWAALQAGALGYVLHALRRWVSGRAGGARAESTVMLAGLLAAPAIYEAARFNQLSLPILAAILGAGVALERGRAGRAGAILGLAASIKLLPAIFLPWLAVTRRWRTLAFALIAAAVINLVPPLLVFGPGLTAEYYAQWWRQNALGPPARGMTDAAVREHFIDHRNQSIPAVLCRVLVADHPYRTAWQPITLSEQSALQLGYAVWAVLFVGSLIVTRGVSPHASTKAAAGAANAGLRAQLAFLLLAMLVLSPLVRTYYLVFALPALVCAADAARGAKSAGGRLAGSLGVVAWLAGMAGWISDAARLYGVHLWMLLLLGAALLVASRGCPNESAAQVSPDSR